MTISLLTGDCRTLLRTLPDASVQCVVTSPPYYGLRDYGTAQWEGGDAACDHTDASFGKGRGNGVWFDGGKPRELEGGRPQPGRTCGKCGARRIDAQLGLEATPDAYIATMVEVFREVKRVLRPDGTVWLNMGDSYSGGKTGRGDTGDGYLREGRTPAGIATQRDVPLGYKPKDLLLMPARLALALQADGWWLRSDIIWAKPNPMPESVTDRPTSAHEHVFLLTRSARYYYDAEAVREESEASSIARVQYNNGPPNPKNVQGVADGIYAATKSTAKCYGQGRNLRNVWTIATHAFPAAHFATFPPELAERCIKAGTSEKGCCSQCGKLWVRQQLRTSADGRSVVVPASQRHAVVDGEPLMGDNRIDIGNRGSFNASRGVLQVTDVGWRAACTCGAEVVPCTVLDCFSGAGTTALVADRLGRHAIGIDLSHAYIEMARERLVADCPLFAELSPPPATHDAEDAAMADLFAALED